MKRSIGAEKPPMDQKKEQAKVRERILKVFKARSQSPGGGPAIVLNNDAKSRRKCAESRIKSREFPKCKLPGSDDDFLLSDSNATPKDEIMEKGNARKLNQQPKEKQTRAYSKQDDPTKSHRHVRVNPHEREEFRKHVKKAREITKQSRHNDSLHSDYQLFVAITQNRLTRQSGLYNQGKKSTRLYRDPLRVSERVAAAVEEEVKMIVDPSDSPNLRHTSMESLPPPALCSTPGISDRKTRSSSRSCKSLTRKREKESEAVSRSHPKSADNHSSGQSAQALDMQDLSVQLVKNLNIKQLFSGGDYAAEIKCELQKLMKSNSAGKEEIISAESVRQYMVSSPRQKNEDKFRRPVISKQTPSIQQKVPVASRVTSDRATAVHHATACVQPLSYTSSLAGGTPHHSQDQVMLLEATTASNPIPRAQNLLDSSSRSLMTDALEFLHFAEAMATECERQQQQANTAEYGRLSSHTPSFSYEVHDRRSNSYHIDYNPTTLSTSSYKIDNDRTSNSTFGSMRGEHLSSYSNDKCRVEWQPDAFHEATMPLKQGYRMDEDFDTRHSALYNKVNSPTDILDCIGVEDMEVAGPSPSLPDPYYLH